MAVDLFPKMCNLCGGTVIFTSNSEIYGKEYGSGKCYLCIQCFAYVGTHEPRPQEAYGILSDERMRKGRKMCHELFDFMWANGAEGKKGQKKALKKERGRMYQWLANKLGIPVAECHFGYFDIHMLRKAYRILVANKCRISVHNLKRDKVTLIQFYDDMVADKNIGTALCSSIAFCKFLEKRKCEHLTPHERYEKLPVYLRKQIIAVVDDYLDSLSNS